MAKYEVVYYETVRLACEIEADSVEEAIAKSDARADWEDCDETTLGTGGVEEVFLGGDLVYPENGHGL